MRRDEAAAAVQLLPEFEAEEVEGDWILICTACDRPKSGSMGFRRSRGRVSSLKSAQRHLRNFHSRSHLASGPSHAPQGHVPDESRHGSAVAAACVPPSQERPVHPRQSGGGDEAPAPLHHDHVATRVPMRQHPVGASTGAAAHAVGGIGPVPGPPSPPASATRPDHALDSGVRHPRSLDRSTSDISLHNIDSPMGMSDSALNASECDDGLSMQGDVSSEGSIASGARALSPHSVSEQPDDSDAEVMAGPAEADPVPTHPSESEADLTDSDSGSECEGGGRRRGPRKNSGAWLHARRLEPLATGHRRSVLQAAFTQVELKKHGASNVVLEKIAQHEYDLLSQFEGEHKPREILMPTSLHMVKQVLGTDEATKYEFGWCEKCAYRFPDDPDFIKKSTEQLLRETCPRCGSDKYQAWSL